MQTKLLKKRRTVNLLFLLFIAIYAATGIIQHNNLRNTSYEALDNSVDILATSLSDRLRTIDKLYYSLELTIDRDLQALLEEMNTLYNQGVLDEAVMENLRGDHEAVHLYVIDKDHMVSMTTYEPDRGLSFDFSPDFTAFLDQVILDNHYTSERISLSTNTSQVTKYAYYGSEDQEVIFEASHDMSEFRDILRDDSLQSLTSGVTDQYEFLIDLDVYNYFGTSAGGAKSIPEITDGEYVTAYQEAKESLASTLYTREADGYQLYTKFIPYAISNFNNSKSVYVIALTYSDALIQAEQQRFLARQALYLVIVGLLFWLYYKYTDQQLIIPLRNMLNSSEKGYYETVKALANAIDAKDNYTGGHCQRVTDLSVLLAKHMGLDKAHLKYLQYGSLLHDIGKIGINDAVLNKVGKFTDDEYNAIKEHPKIGFTILSNIDFLEEANEIVLYHHEKVDGTGYPTGIKGDSIPYLARILAITDAFDAMTSKRVYKPTVMTVEEAFTELRRCSGTQFDPDLVESFIEAYQQAYGTELALPAEAIEESL